MSREIKFRAWNNEQKIMCYQNEDESAEYQDGAYGSDVQILNSLLKGFLEIYEWMQYTGLNDVNGVEIYEGDIIPVYEKGQEYNYKVIYDGDCFMLSVLDTEQGSYPLSVKNRTSKVVGNIYQNPFIK